MRYIFKVGPFQVCGGPPQAMYISFGDGKMDFEPAMADEQGLQGLIRRGSAAGAVCEPQLAEAARKLGLEVRPLNEECVLGKAVLSVISTNRETLEGNRDKAVLLELIDAAAAFFTAKPWTGISSFQMIDIQIDGGMRHLFESTVAGGQSREIGLFMFFRVGDAPRFEEAARLRDRKLVAPVEMMTLMYDLAPGPITSAIQDVTGILFAPVLLRMRLGEPVALKPAEVAVLAASLRAVADLARTGDEGRGACASGPVQVTATARLRLPS
jgi:hypothetical protein